MRTPAFYINLKKARRDDMRRKGLFKKRLLAGVMAMLLTCQMLPAAAAEDGVPSDETIYGPEEASILTAAGNLIWGRSIMLLLPVLMIRDGKM